jgi:hypothetical protein
MARARDIANIINVVPSIYATDDEVAADYLSKVDAATDYVDKEEAQAPFRNLIINGAMQVAQRGTSVTGITANGYYTADRWRFVPVNQGTWTMSVENDAPTGSGFRKSAKVLCTTADAAPAADDVLFLEQPLEGQNLQAIRKGTADAQQLTLSFWVKSNVTGTYVCNLRDQDNTRVVCATYTINSSATWENKTIVFPADTTGVLDNDNNNSFRVFWWLGGGSDVTSGTLNTTWDSVTAANIAVGQTNLAAATDNYWQVTGVQLEVGAVATPFEFKPFDQDLRECQRYYYVVTTGGANRPIGPGTNYAAGTLLGYIKFPTTMRENPTLEIVTGTNYYEFVRNGGLDGFNSLTQDAATTEGANVFNNTEISGTAGHGGIIIANNAAAKVAFGIEL